MDESSDKRAPRQPARAPKPPAFDARLAAVEAERDALALELAEVQHKLAALMRARR